VIIENIKQFSQNNCHKNSDSFLKIALQFATCRCADRTGRRYQDDNKKMNNIFSFSRNTYGTLPTNDFQARCEKLLENHGPEQV